MDRKKILVVDDERHLVQIIKFNLEKKGFSVLTAYDGEEAVKKINEEEIDLLILDIMLPRISGFEICKRVRENARTRNLPIIILTAKGQEFDRNKAIRLGADFYVTKPFSPKALIEKVGEFLVSKK